MTEIKKLIEEIDEDINKAEWQIKTAREMDSKDVERRFLERKANLTKIKGILKQQRQPDEELVEKIYLIGAEHLLNDNTKEIAKAEIRKLLAEKQSPPQANRFKSTRSDDKLAEEIVTTVSMYVRISTPPLSYEIDKRVYPKILTLLQAQPKARITRGEITRMDIAEVVVGSWVASVPPNLSLSRSITNAIAELFGVSE